MKPACTVPFRFTGVLEESGDLWKPVTHTWSLGYIIINNLSIFLIWHYGLWFFFHRDICSTINNLPTTPEKALSAGLTSEIPIWSVPQSSWELQLALRVCNASGKHQVQRLDQGRYFHWAVSGIRQPHAEKTRESIWPSFDNKTTSKQAHTKMHLTSQ